MSVVLFKTQATGTAVVTVLAAVPRIEMQSVGGFWTDITNRWRADTPIVLSYGIQGSDPTDRVASAGSLEWQMDNGARNGNLGESSTFGKTRFDPSWKLGVPIRFSIGQASGTRQYKFQGTLGAAIPSPDGQHGERRTFCTALDLWDDWARMPLPDQPAVQNRTSGQLVTALINSLPLAQQPTGNSSIEAGAETFEWAFDGGMGQQIAVRERFNDIALSEPSYIYSRGGATGTQFVHETLTTRIAKTVLFTLDDAAITNIVAPGSREDLYGTVRIRVYPPVVDPDPVAVIYALDSPTTLVGANTTMTSIVGPYRGNVDDMVGATAQLQPAATTDYTMNSAPNGTGTDLTAAFNVTAFFTGVSVRFQVQNTGGTPGYLTKLQVRGQILARKNTLVEKTIAGSYGVRMLDFDMPYQGNANKAESIATYFQTIYGSPYAQVSAVRFCATRTQALFDAAMFREPGDRIALTESTTGLTTAPFTINSAQWEIYRNGSAWVTWGLEQSTAAPGWALDEGQLDSNTVLGF
jgi:hypothetical protein